MNKRDMLPQIKKFLKETYDTLSKGFEGCCYLHLDEGLYIVAAKIDDRGYSTPVCKLAYNCDSLQSDYEYDWFMPVYKDEDVAIVELELSDSKKDIHLNAEYLYTEAKAMINFMKIGLIKDWRN